MKKLVILVAVILCSVVSKGESWNAGVSSAVITPEKPMWMAGYGSRKAPSAGKRTDLFAKVLFLEAGDDKSVVICLDLVGIDRDLSLSICSLLKEKYSLERHQIAICTSHTHSGPVVGRNLAPLHYLFVSSDQRTLIDEYADYLEKEVVSLVGKAIESAAPARVQWGSGKSTFAVNRRNNKPYSEVPEKRAKGTLLGPVDHDVPVLTVRDPEEGALRAILFGYACHATVLSLSEWNGDYPGYAQAELEKQYPGAVALFWAGCGGDQNPLPRKTVELAEIYGKELARSVSDVIKAPMPELQPELKMIYREIKAPLAEIPPREKITANLKSTNIFERGRSKMLLRQMEKKGALEGHYPYPIGYWKLGGEIDFFFLGGEVVVDYANRLKRESSGTKTWVAAYANDVMAYIPSLRVLREGGYEGGGSNVYYGLPSLWSEKIEETIIFEALKCRE